MPRNPPMHTRFQPGISGNPGGRSKHYLTRTIIKKTIDKFLSLTREELEKIMADTGKTPALELMIASTILYCIKAGDYSRLEALLSRAVGKVKEDIEEDLDSNTEISKLSMNELLTLVKTPENKE